MRVSSKKSRYLVAAFMLMLSNSVFSAVETIRATITSYSTGWGSDQVRITLKDGDYTLGGCTVQDGFMTTLTDNAGYTTHISTLLAAHMAGKEVSLAIDSCGTAGRPKIVGVRVY